MTLAFSFSSLLWGTCYIMFILTKYMLGNFYILSLICREFFLSFWIQNSQLQMGDMEISKYNIMGGEGLKKITIYILRHNGGRSKNGGGGVICSKVILMPQKILNKTSNFWPNVSKTLNNCIPELAQDTRLFFWIWIWKYKYTTWNVLLNEYKISCGVFIFWV